MSEHLRKKNETNKGSDQNLSNSKVFFLIPLFRGRGGIIIVRLPNYVIYKTSGTTERTDNTNSSYVGNTVHSCLIFC